MEEKKAPGEILIDAFKSPTKIRIITLLMRYGPMSVTDLSKYIGTTRSNLYQTMKDLLEKGIVKPPEERVVKNYVEKIYSLNSDLFNAVKSKDIKGLIAGLSNEDMKTLITSFVSSITLLINSFSEEISQDPSSLDAVRKAVRDGAMIASISSISERHMLEFSRMFDEFADRIEEENESEDYMLIAFGYPIKRLK